MTDWTEIYRHDGFATLRGALAPDEVEALRAETVTLCRGERGAIAGFEPPPPALDDDAAQARVLCVHQPHKISPAILESLRHPAIVAALTAVVSPNVKCMQTMLFIKSAGKPGQAWHQDEAFIPTRDRSLTAAWIALDDATTENGCLWAIPGSQRAGVLWPQYPHDDPNFDCSIATYGYPHSDDEAVPIEARAGDVVLFDGHLLHRSLPNRAASGFRRALVCHYMSAESLLPWGPTPASQKSGVQNAMLDWRDIVMVAGSDPYEWKGTEELSAPSVRPANQGGCGDGRMDLDAWLDFAKAHPEFDANPHARP